MTITFKVDNVSPVTPSLERRATQKEQFLKQSFAKVGIKGGTVEAHKFTADSARFYETDKNSFVMTVYEAFDRHCPIAFSPDDVWLAAAQAVSKHIELNPEDCRKAIVSWEGKKTLIVENDDFFKGSPDNDWPREFQKFAVLIKENLGKKADMFNPTFTTTGPIEQTAIHVQMMSALAPYFDYRMYTRCGVPTVTLLGTPEDWDAIVQRVSAFGEFYPKWALDPLLEAVGHFASAAKGSADMDFWQNFFKSKDGSGGTPVTGWINAFFPYIDKTPNKMMQGNFKDAILLGARAGNDIGQFGGSVCTAPLHWNYLGTVYNMSLATGMMGTTVIEVDGKKTLKTVVGWAVGETREK